MSAILPMSDRVKERQNVDRAKLLLSSLECFWADEHPLEIYVVMPDSERVAIEGALKGYNLGKNIKLTFLDETSISPYIADAPSGYGIAKHMLIKLTAEAFVYTDFYIVLDSDIVACKSISTDVLLCNGRALTYYYPPEPQAWWNGSEKVLNYLVDGYRSGKNRIFVTPEILSCEIMRQLHVELERLFGGSWIKGLIDRFDPNSNEFWTEYTLYDLYAVKNGIFHQYHVDEADIKEPLHCMDQSLWIPQHIADWQPLKAFNGESRGYFMVLQSIMANDIDFNTMRDRVVDAALAAGHTLNLR